VAQVADGFRDGDCPDDVEVSYDPIFKREPGGLLSNTVPALVVGRDGALWFGTAFGLVHLQNGQFTPIPFDPELSLQGNPETLEEFFQEVAVAIFTAQPLSTVGIGDISFLAEFGSPLVKGDLIFSMVESDSQEHLWVGTLGGGLRRLDIRSSPMRETLHLTRQEGLSSNIVFALAEGPDGSIWAATEEGVSRIRAVDNTVTITNFSALDGLALPVRDVAVDATGAVWLATDGGLFRIVLP
jgi:ligand-binding sensor domain-containing protein